MSYAKPVFFGLAQLILATLAVIAFYKLLIETGVFEKLEKQVEAEAHAGKATYTGFAPLDGRLHGLVLVFASPMSNVAGSALVDLFFTTPVLFLFADVDRTAFYLPFSAFYFFFFQFFGISIFFPLVMAFLSWRRYNPIGLLQDPERNKTRVLHGVTNTRVNVILVTQLVVFLYGYMKQLDPESQMYRTVFAMFLLWPCVIPLAFLVVPSAYGRTDTKREAHTQLVKSYVFTAVAAAATYWLWMYRLYNTYRSFNTFYADLTFDASSQFIAVDFVIYNASLLLFVLSDGSIAELILVLLMTPFIGPSAAPSVWLAIRENALGKRDEAVRSGKAKKQK